MMNYLAFLVPYGKVSDGHMGVQPIFYSCHQQRDGQYECVVVVGYLNNQMCGA